MRNFYLPGLACITLLAAPIQPAVASEIDWGEAAKKIRYFSPSAFPNAPQQAREKLMATGCKIPQADFDSDGKDHEPNNLIKGSFTGRGRTEWAVLCSVNAESKLVLLHGKNFSRVAELSRLERDQDMLQSARDGDAYYSRVIGTISPSGIKRYSKREGGVIPLIDHDGIEDGIQGKGSSVRYFIRGKWIDIPGSD